MQNPITECKAMSEKEMPQASQPTVEAQPRPRWQLVKELKEVANQTSTEFHLWYEKLTAEERVSLGLAP
jgi:hypothetical protein